MVITKGVESWRTAIHRKRTSAPVRFYSESGLLNGEVLDYGAGKDVHPYAKYDPYYYHDNWVLLEKKWNVVMCNYVLNVIEHTKDREKVLETIKGLLKPNGYALVAIYQRSKHDTRTTKGFQSGWGVKEWENLFLSHFKEVERLPAKGLHLWRLLP